MRSKIIEIKDAIKNKLDDMSTLFVVRDYETGKIDGYPFATVTHQNGESEFGDSAGSLSGRNIMSLDYIVNIYQERNEDLFGAEKAEDVSLSVLDELLVAFHNDITLSGTVLWQHPSSWELSYDQTDNVVRTMQVIIQVAKEISVK